MQGLIGKKMGMTQVFDAEGRRVAVTVIQAGPCRVVQRKTLENDGYAAVQLGFGEQKAHRVGKAELGRFKRIDAPPCRCLREFGVDNGEELKAGDTVTVADVFGETRFVDVVGITKGRGFQGAVKRYRMGGGRMTHGGHSKRRIGAIGQCAYPARVAKGKRMPGHMGRVRVTLQNLAVVQVRGEDNLLLVRGAVPGPTGALVEIRKALKKAGKGQ
jgi:large subunit ribosomal protein L3